MILFQGFSCDPKRMIFIPKLENDIYSSTYWQLILKGLVHEMNISLKAYNVEKVLSVYALIVFEPGC